jgi:hypothetical protein
MVKRSKEYTIEAIGRYNYAVIEYPTDEATDQATKAIADMLRYDGGRVVYLDVVKENHSFTAIVKSERYTIGRWNSFGIRTREVNWDSYTNEEEVKIQWNV